MLSESCKEGGILLLGNEDKPIFRGYVLPDQPELLVIFYKLFQLRQTHRIRMPLFLLDIFGTFLGSVRQETFLMIVKHHHVHTLHIQAIYKDVRGYNF